MTADANSAFGDALGASRARQRPDDRSDMPDVLPPHLSADPLPSAYPAYEYTPRSMASVKTPGARAARLSATADWFDASSFTPSALEVWFHKLQIHLTSTFADQVTPVRLAGHISVLMVAATVLILSNVNMPDWDMSLRLFPNSTLLGTDSTNASAQINSLLTRAGGSFSGNESLQRAAVPFTTLHAQPTQEVAAIQQYTVQAGDTVLAIAEKFGLKPETVQWSNPGLEVNADLIRPGDTLSILPINGALHTVTSGDTLGGIAGSYRVTVEDIINYSGNGLADPNAPLTIGAKLIVPNATKEFAGEQAFTYTTGAAPANAKIGGGNFVWPASGSINQRFWSGHAAVDVGAWTGAPVKAADGGYVAVATGGWNAGYGNHVIIDHGNGFVTLYAHLNSVFVNSGESVAAGQQIGSVGNTGNSTGPHLHFELRYQGVPRNPLNYLP